MRPVVNPNPDEHLEGSSDTEQEDSDSKRDLNAHEQDINIEQLSPVLKKYL